MLCYVFLGEAGPVPSSQLPSHCGFSVMRARRDVSVVAKYDCCNIGQQVMCS